MSSGASRLPSGANALGSATLLPKSMAMSYLPGTCGFGQTSVVFQLTQPGTIGTTFTFEVMPGPEMSSRAVEATQSAGVLCRITEIAALALTSPGGKASGSRAAYTSVP